MLLQLEINSKSNIVNESPGASLDLTLNALESSH